MIILPLYSFLLLRLSWNLCCKCIINRLFRQHEFTIEDIILEVSLLHEIARSSPRCDSGKTLFDSYRTTYFEGTPGFKPVL